jgi:fibronectin type 3 domain-containing protein
LSLKATANDGEVRLTWNRPFLDTNGKKLRAFDGYHVYRTSVSGQYAGPPIHEAALTDTSFVDTAVVNGETYYYVVQSVASVTDTIVVGEASAEVSATPIDRQAPDAPIDLTSVYLANTVKLFWNFSASQDWKGFNVYRGISADGPFQLINPQPVLQPAYEDDTAIPQHIYYYYVTSFDKSVPPNESQPSNVVQVKTDKR